MIENRDIYQEKREFIKQQLSEFYDPIVALLTANSRIFSRIGPTSEARISGLFDDNETAQVWIKLSKEVIVPNNMRVCEIIESKFHLRDKEDEEDEYLEFVTHSYAYQVFKDGAYEAYRLFPYPEVLKRAKSTRDRLRYELDSCYTEQKKGFF